jgi:hypothetical protein
LTRPHNDAGELRVVRPGRQTTLPTDPGSAQDHLCRPGPRAKFEGRHPHAGALLSRRLNDQLVTAARWDDLLRVAASVHGGHATAALVVGKLCSSKRQRALWRR